MTRSPHSSADSRLALFAAVLLAVCSAGAATVTVADAPDSAGEAERTVAEDVLVRALAPGVWLHRTINERDGALVSANGLLVAGERFTLLIDTGWRPDQTRELLRWAESTSGKPVEHVIVTHAHEDRAGGLSAISKQSAIVQGHASTAARLAGGERALDWTFDFQETLVLGGEKVVLFYPGAGHAPDNIVVWLPSRGVLFGGCLIRPTAAHDLGFTGDADPAAWSFAVRRVISTFRDARIVVPGHGASGGVELLSHTMDLLEAASAAPDVD